MTILKGYGAPTTATTGNVGDYYIDLNTDAVYKCFDVNVKARDYGFVDVSDYALANNEYQWVSVGGAGDISWNDLKDRPFGEKIVLGDTVTFNGNPDDYERFDVVVEGTTYTYLKISDAVPTLEDCENGITEQLLTGHIGTWDYDNLSDYYDDDGCVHTDGFIAVPSDEFVFKSTVTFPTAGIWIMYVSGSTVASITIPGFGKFASTVIEPIDEKYLPFTDMKPVAYVEGGYNSPMYLYSDPDLTTKMSKTEVAEFFFKGGLVHVGYTDRYHALSVCDLGWDYARCTIWVDFDGNGATSVYAYSLEYETAVTPT